jgi:phosphoribosylformimino-5-aminoimidazole carboxamide ribotide isomerase
MHIIPVIDLKDGQVVHAVRGDRQHYKAIHLYSRLTASSNIAAVMSGFLNLYPFRTFYIADLNAITGQGEHNALIADLLTKHPNIEFWIDNGSRLAEPQPNPTKNYRAVIGTESQLAATNHADQDFILSLDFKQEQATGDPAWFNDSRYWPQQVIIMTLSRVGGKTGPDLQKLAEYTGKYPQKNIIAAGGVRDFDDLIKLKNIGVNSTLLATALHAGTLSTAEIGKL